MSTSVKESQMKPEDRLKPVPPPRAEPSSDLPFITPLSGESALSLRSDLKLAWDSFLLDRFDDAVFIARMLIENIRPWADPSNRSGGDEAVDANLLMASAEVVLACSED